MAANTLRARERRAPDRPEIPTEQTARSKEDKCRPPAQRRMPLREGINMEMGGIRWNWVEIRGLKALIFRGFRAAEGTFLDGVVSQIEKWVK